LLDQEISELASRDLPLMEIAIIEIDKTYVVAAIADNERPRVAGRRVALKVNDH
jgi:hypothetical protein